MTLGFEDNESPHGLNQCLCADSSIVLCFCGGVFKHTSHSLGRQLSRADGFHAPAFPCAKGNAAAVQHKVPGNLSAAALGCVKSTLQPAGNLGIHKSASPLSGLPYRGNSDFTVGAVNLRRPQSSFLGLLVSKQDWEPSELDSNRVLQIIHAERCFSQRFQTLTPKVRQQNAS